MYQQPNQIQMPVPQMKHGGLGTMGMQILQQALKQNPASFAKPDTAMPVSMPPGGGAAPAAPGGGGLGGLLGMLGGGGLLGMLGAKPGMDPNSGLPVTADVMAGAANPSFGAGFSPGRDGLGLLGGGLLGKLGIGG